MAAVNRCAFAMVAILVAGMLVATAGCGDSSTVLDRQWRGRAALLSKTIGEKRQAADQAYQRLVDGKSSFNEYILATDQLLKDVESAKQEASKLKK